MLKINIDNTIAAIATPIGEAGIGIVRMSGRDALPIADKIFASKDNGRPSEYETYTIHYGHIVVPKDEGRTTQDEIIDEALLTVMRAPRTYTREDIIEINCHGGMAPLKKVLELVLFLGARLAEPGEFTKRAFLNGRVDLAQAEAVLDIIRAKTEKALDAALLQLRGGLSDSIRDLRRRLIDIKARLEASVDFPDEELDVDSPEAIGEMILSVSGEMQNLLSSFSKGRVIREGLNCVICGKANVGKSSLMNALLKEERMIVTPIPGTTRDAVSEYINIGGVPVNLIDTAGISQSQNPLDKEGVRRSRLMIEKADLILFVLDASEGFLKEDMAAAELIRDKEIVCIVNKIDLTRRMAVNRAELKKYFKKEVPCVEISVLKKINLESVPQAVLAKVHKGEVFVSDYNVLTNARHRDSILKAREAVKEAAVSLKNAQPEEIIAISLNEGINALSEITGESISEDVLERIFSQFCIGK